MTMVYRPPVQQLRRFGPGTRGSAIVHDNDVDSLTVELGLSVRAVVQADLEYQSGLTVGDEMLMVDVQVTYHTHEGDTHKPKDLAGVSVAAGRRWILDPDTGLVTPDLLAPALVSRLSPDLTGLTAGDTGDFVAYDNSIPGLSLWAFDDANGYKWTPGSSSWKLSGGAQAVAALPDLALDANSYFDPGNLLFKIGAGLYEMVANGAASATADIPASWTPGSTSSGNDTTYGFRIGGTTPFGARPAQLPATISAVLVDDNGVYVEAAPGAFGQDGLVMEVGGKQYALQYLDTSGNTDYFHAATSGYLFQAAGVEWSLHSRSTKPFTASGKSWSLLMPIAAADGVDYGAPRERRTLPPRPWHVGQRFINLSTGLTYDKTPSVTLTEGTPATGPYTAYADIPDPHIASVVSYNQAYSGDSATRLRGNAFVVTDRVASSAQRAKTVTFDGTDYAVATGSYTRLGTQYLWQVANLTPTLMSPRVAHTLQITRGDDSLVWPAGTAPRADISWDGNDWVVTPGVAPTWVTDPTVPIPRSKLPHQSDVEIAAGPGAGLAIVSSASNANSLRTPFNPVVDLDTHSRGVFIGTAHLTISQYGSTTIGWNDRHEKTLELNLGTLFASQILGSDVYNGTSALGVKMTEHTIYNAATTLGRLEFWMSRTAANEVAYQWRYVAIGGTDHFNIASTIYMSFLRNDPGGGGGGITWETLLDMNFAPGVQLTGRGQQYLGVFRAINANEIDNLLEMQLVSSTSAGIAVGEYGNEGGVLIGRVGTLLERDLIPSAGTNRNSFRMIDNDLNGAEDFYVVFNKLSDNRRRVQVHRLATSPALYIGYCRVRMASFG